EDAVTRRWDRDANGQWSHSTLPLDFRRLRALVETGGQPLAVIQDRANSALQLAYLRTTSLLPLGNLEVPSGVFDVLWLAARPLLLEWAGERGLSVRPIDPLDGRIGAAQRLELQPMSAQRTWQLGLIVAVILVSIFLLFIAKPLIAPNSPLPR